jgi:hypothetical protein
LSNGLLFADKQNSGARIQESGFRRGTATALWAGINLKKEKRFRPKIEVKNRILSSQKAHAKSSGFSSD